jgi:hypothetical protein
MYAWAIRKKHKFTQQLLIWKSTKFHQNSYNSLRGETPNGRTRHSHFAYSLRIKLVRFGWHRRKHNALPHLYGHKQLTRATPVHWGDDIHANHRRQTLIYSNWPHKRLKSEWICIGVLVGGFVTPRRTSVLKCELQVLHAHHPEAALPTTLHPALQFLSVTGQARCDLHCIHSARQHHW